MAPGFETHLLIQIPFHVRTASGTNAEIDVNIVNASEPASQQKSEKLFSTTTNLRYAASLCLFKPPLRKALLAAACYSLYICVGFFHHLSPVQLSSDLTCDAQTLLPGFKHAMPHPVSHFLGSFGAQCQVRMGLVENLGLQTAKVCTAKVKDKDKDVASKLRKFLQLIKANPKHEAARDRRVCLKMNCRIWGEMCHFGLVPS